jgi:hypothetical protein
MTLGTTAKPADWAASQGGVDSAYQSLWDDLLLGMPLWGNLDAFGDGGYTPAEVGSLSYASGTWGDELTGFNASNYVNVASFAPPDTLTIAILVNFSSDAARSRIFGSHDALEVAYKGNLAGDYLDNDIYVSGGHNNAGLSPVTATDYLFIFESVWSGDASTRNAWYATAAAALSQIETNATDGTSSKPGTGDLYVGTRQNATSDYLRGNISMFMMWDKALTSGERSALEGDPFGWVRPAAAGVDITINPAALALAGQTVTPTAGVDIPINTAALTLAGQPLIPTAGVDIPVAPAALTLAGQTITPVAGTPPGVEITLNPAALALAGQSLTPEVGVGIGINPAALALAGQTITPSAGATAVEITLNPAALTLAGQAFTPTAGAEPVAITILPATMAIVTQGIVPAVPGLDPVVVLINPANLSLAGQSIMPEITGPGELVGLSQPGSVTVATTNLVSGDGSHYHEVVASSNPGANESLLRSATDGSIDLTNLRLSGDLAVNGGDITSTGNMAITPGGTLALNALIESHLRPSLTDTYDLGSELKLWRKAWISEMQAVLFVENTISAIGGWFIVPHGQGTLGDEVDDTQTAVDFGQSMTASDFVIMRGLTDGGLPKVEYLQVGALDSGTLYNVTRDVDGSGANEWPAGQVYIIYGNSGDGRIEFDAQTAGPRISVIEQGATYNAQTERVRLGDMDGWKIGVSGYGIGIGDPTGTHLYYTPAAGLVIAADGGGLTNIDGGEIQTGTITADKITTTTLSAISANLGTITAGTITAATIRTAASGARVQMDSSGIFGTNGTTVQWEASNTDGKLAAGAGKVILDSEGITGIVGTSAQDASSFKFKSGTNIIGHLTGWYDDFVDLNSIEVSTRPLALSASAATFKADAPAGYLAYTRLMAQSGGYDAYFQIQAQSATRKAALYNAPLSLGQGLYVGSTSATPDDDDIHFDGNLKSVKSGITYDVYGLRPLTTPLTSTAWDGDDSKATGTYTLTPATFGYPAAAKSVNVLVSGQWTAASAANNCSLRSSSGGTNIALIRSQIANFSTEMTVTVPTDASGNFYLVVSGATMNNAVVRVAGYHI